MNARRLVYTAISIGATQLVHAQATPPVHPVGAIVAKTKEPIGVIAGVNVLRDGHVLVGDDGTGRVLLFDSTLTTFSVLLDTTGMAQRKYPVRLAPVLPNGSPAPTTLRAGGVVFPFRGDSTAFYDPVAIALVIFDPGGRIARVMAPPYPPDAPALGQLLAGGARFDPSGRAVYEGRTVAPPVSQPTTTTQVIPVDSGPIVRVAPGSVAPETLAYVREPRSIAARVPLVTKDGPTVSRVVRDPFALGDAWVMLRDGTIAIFRCQDYHIDWIAPDGARTSSPKLPFQWHRLSDSDKVKIIDSVKALSEANPRTYLIPVNESLVRASVPDDVIPPDSLTDYRPPFTPGAILGVDGDQNVWIHPTPEVPLSSGPGRVFDVIDRAGKLIDRVEVGPGFGVVAFSPGYIFMQIREGATTVLVKAKIR